MKPPNAVISHIVSKGDAYLEIYKISIPDDKDFFLTPNDVRFLVARLLSWLVEYERELSK